MGVDGSLPPTVDEGRKMECIWKVNVETKQSILLLLWVTLIPRMIGLGSWYLQNKQMISKCSFIENVSLTL